MVESLTPVLGWCRMVPLMGMFRSHVNEAVPVLRFPLGKKVEFLRKIFHLLFQALSLVLAPGGALDVKLVVNMEFLDSLLLESWSLWVVGLAAVVCRL